VSRTGYLSRIKNQKPKTLCPEPKTFCPEPKTIKNKKICPEPIKG
jgi:hypothetical protein